MPTDADDRTVRRRHRLTAVVAGIVVLLFGGAVVAVQTDVPRTVTVWFDDTGLDYPDIDVAILDPLAQRVVAVTRAEYDAQPDGAKYAEGIEENWCADFVSWVMNESGHPLENPNSGSWRIPGVYTLTEYFQAEKRFHSADSGRRPSTGDVVLYAPGSRFGQHTNIVLRIDDDLMITVGGNEQGRIRVDEVPLAEPDVVGFGEM